MTIYLQLRGRTVLSMWEQWQPAAMHDKVLLSWNWLSARPLAVLINLETGRQMEHVLSFSPCNRINVDILLYQPSCWCRQQILSAILCSLNNQLGRYVLLCRLLDGSIPLEKKAVGSVEEAPFMSSTQRCNNKCCSCKSSCSGVQEEVVETNQLQTLKG